jgi:hypothetical protein
VRLGARIPIFYSTSLSGTGHHHGLFYATYIIYIYIYIYTPEATSLALYPHGVNKFVLIVLIFYFMWL